MEPVLPSIIGRVGSARNTVRAVRMPNALDGLGESISRAGKGIAGAANSIVGDLTRLQMERNEADYAKAMTEFEADVDKQIDALKDRTGFAAVGTPEAVGNIYEQAMAKYGKNLRGSSLDRFRERAMSRRNAQTRWGMDFERDQLTKAENTAFNERLKGGVAQFRRDLDHSYIDNSLSDYDDMKRRTDKYGQLPTELLESFEKNYNREKGTLKVPDRTATDGTVTPGKTLEIGKDITEERVEQIRENLVKHKEAYEKERQRITDLHIASGVEGILESGDAPEAQEFLMAMESQGYRVSDGAKASMEVIITKHLDTYVRNSRITAQIDTISADSLNVGSNAVYSAGGRYLTPELESQMTEYLADLQRKAESGDPDDVKNFKTASDMWYNRKRLMEQQEQHDYAKELKKLSDSGALSEAKVDETISKLAQGAANKVSAQLYATALKQRDAYHRKRAGSTNRKKDTTLIERAIFLALADPDKSDGRVTLPGQSEPYNLNDEKSRHRYCLALGMTPDEIREMDAKISREAHLYTNHAAKQVAEILNEMMPEGKKVFDPMNVLAVAPELISEAMFVVNKASTDPTKYKDYSDQMRTHLLRVIKNLETSKAQSWVSPDKNLAKWLYEGIGEDGRPLKEKDNSYSMSFSKVLGFGLTPETLNAWAAIRKETEEYVSGNDAYEKRKQGSDNVNAQVGVTEPYGDRLYPKKRAEKLKQEQKERDERNRKVLTNPIDRALLFP